MQLAALSREAVIADEQGTSLSFGILKKWQQEIGSMAFSREMIASAIALEGVTHPEDFITMAENTIGSFLGFVGEPGKGFEVSNVQIKEEDQPPGVVGVDLMLTPPGQVVVRREALVDSVRRVLALLQREGIETIVFTVTDLARAVLEFVAADLPAYGLKTFWLYPRGLHEQEHAALASSLTGQSSVSKASPHPFIENEFYRVEASQEDGTLTVTDKQNGAVFTGLNRFVDGGDVGDLYNYCPPAQDLLVSEPVDAPKIEVLSTGPVRAMLLISGRWLLPGACDPSRAERSSHTVLCHIDSEISLAPGVRRIDIHTRVENRAKDHRLRVIFPVSYTVESAAAEGTFEVRSRPVALPRPPDVAEWAEEPVNTFPQKRFVDVSNGTHGLAVLNRGLPEYEVVQEGPGITDKDQIAIAVTLLRCVEWLSRGDLPTRRGHAAPMEYTPEAQCLGRHEFDYALISHSGTWQSDEACVLREAQAFNIPVHTRTIVTEQHDGSLPSRATFVEVEPRSLVVSAVKRSNDGRGLIVRVYNPLSETVTAKIQPGVAFVQAYMTNLLEEHQELVASTPHHAQTVEVAIRSGEIRTFVFE